MVRKLLFSSSLLLMFVINSFAQVSNADFHFLDRIEGKWGMRTKSSIFRERWTRVNEDNWEGVSWRIAGKDSVKQDDMRLIRTPEGIFYTIAAVKDQNGQPLRFKLRVLKAVGFVAENPESPYPQKIVYRWKDNRRMEAHFEGKQEKTFSEIILQYVKE